MTSYPAEPTYETDGGVVLCFPDLPEIVAQGDDLEAAIEDGKAMLTAAIALHVRQRQDFPAPGPIGPAMVAVPLTAQAEAKLGLWTALREAGLGKPDLARLLGLHPPQVDRLLDPRHATRLDTLERALAAVGKRMRLTVLDAA